MIPKKLRRRQYLLRAGDVCRWLVFVSEGCLRLYSLVDLGKEHIQRFADEGWWITDTVSLRTRQPATTNIDALEDSELFLPDHASFENLSAATPKWGDYYTREIENALQYAHIRVSDFVSVSAEDRYVHFAATYPDLVQRISLYQNASDLGITPQSLSRIRRELANRR